MRLLLCDFKLTIDYPCDTFFPLKRIILLKQLPSKYVIAKWCSLRTWLHLKDSISTFYFTLTSCSWCKKSRNDSAQMGTTHLRSHLTCLPSPVCDTALPPLQCLVLDLKGLKSQLTLWSLRLRSVQLPKDKKNNARPMETSCVLDCRKISSSLLGENHKNDNKKDLY